ncbi:MAG: protein-L-isoaspartate(D-aspartate) O-methyltransferase [Anaerolineae bacterium]|nr:protein-L-isoaspartate(D-aspartate) O-methyltransferase [Anaerolineae bacterium]
MMRNNQIMVTLSRITPTLLGFGLISIMIAACSPAAPKALIEPAQAPLVTEGTSDPFTQDRLDMVTNQIESRGVTDSAVLAAIRVVPRHFFVPDFYQNQAYANHPLPIGYGQTISQPLIVALMTELLGLSPGERVLEIGTGSGYQAAVLAEMGMEVYTVEIIPELATKAKDDLERAGYAQVRNFAADGYFGWQEYAPFDAIIVTAAPDHLPQPLVTQLKDGGNLVIPIGPIGAVQSLWLFQKVNGEIEAMNYGLVRFVPFTRTEE